MRRRLIPGRIQSLIFCAKHQCHTPFEVGCVRGFGSVQMQLKASEAFCPEPALNFCPGRFNDGGTEESA